MYRPIPISYRLERLMKFLSRSKHIPAADAMALARKFARKHSANPGYTLRCTEFDYARGDTFFRGSWHLNGRSIWNHMQEKWDRETVDRATREALIEGRQLIPDYFEYRESMLRTRVNRSERKVVQVRRMVRQFKESLNEATKEHRATA